MHKFVIPINESDEAFACCSRTSTFRQEAFHELADALANTYALTQAGAHQPFIHDVISAWTGTHFMADGSKQVGQALKGTRPGHPYADAVFAFDFQRVLRSVAKRLDQDQLRPTIPTGDPATLHAQVPTSYVALPIPCFFDDFIVVIFSELLSTLMPKASKTLTAIAGGLAARKR